MIVENRPGASGKIAFDALQNAPADGVTVLIAPASVIELGPMVLPTLKFDALKDFVPIGSLAEYGFAVATGPISGAKNIASYQAWAKANSSESSYATPGVGTPQHFLGAQLKKALGIELIHVPYKGGANSITDVMGGQIPMLITTEQVVIPHQGTGKLSTLFVTSKRRNPLMPEVPTAREVGLGELESMDWFGAFVKPGTPTEKVDTWKRQVRAIVASSGYADAMKKLGYGVPERQPSNFAALITSERSAWAERVKLSGFKHAD